MVRSKGLEPSRLLGTTTSRLRVYQFHHERITLVISLLRIFGIWLFFNPLTSANIFFRKTDTPSSCLTCAWRIFERDGKQAYSASKPTTWPPSTVAFTLIGLQQFSQSETRSIFPSIPSGMTRVSELQKGQEMVVVDSRRLFPFSF